jgi:hypothetical protein
MGVLRVVPDRFAAACPAGGEIKGRSQAPD